MRQVTPNKMNNAAYRTISRERQARKESACLARVSRSRQSALGMAWVCVQERRDAKKGRRRVLSRAGRSRISRPGASCQDSRRPRRRAREWWHAVKANLSSIPRKPRDGDVAGVRAEVARPGSGHVCGASVRVACVRRLGGLLRSA